MQLELDEFNPRWGTAVFLGTAFVYLYLTVFLLPATPIFFENDHFIQMYDALRILGGDVMYRDFFQFTFPGTQVWYLALFSVFGDRIWLLNATILFLGFSLTWTVLAISRRMMTGIYVYVAPSLFVFFGFRWYGMDGGHRLFSCLFASLAILVLLDRINVNRVAAAGALCALSAMFTQTRGLGMVAAIGIYLTWHYYPYVRQGEITELIKSGFVLGTSFGISLLILSGYFLWTAGPGTFIESTILFAKNYNSDPANDTDLYFQFWQGLVQGNFSLSSLPVDLFYYLLVPAVYIIPTVYYIVRKPANREFWDKVLLLSISGLCLFLVTTGLNQIRLYHVSIPGLVLVSIWCSTLRWRAIPLGAVGIAVTGSAALCIWGQVKTYSPVTDLPTGTVVFPSNAAAEKYRWLNDNTDPGDLVFESFRTVVNFPLRLRNPASVPMLRDTNYTSAEQIDRVINELEARPPKFILWDGTWSKPASERSASDHLGPMYAYLQTRYRLRQELPPVYGIDIEVWEPKGVDGN